MKFPQAFFIKIILLTSKIGKYYFIEKLTRELMIKVGEFMLCVLHLIDFLQVFIAWKISKNKNNKIVLAKKFHKNVK